MKCTVIIDSSLPEEVVIHSHENSALVSEIRRICDEDELSLMGYTETSVQKLPLSDICFFAVEGSHVKAHTVNGLFRLKCRLYVLEETLPDRFIKINQSCIANISMIERFDTSITGTLLVRFKNGEKDYVSRRNIRRVKERVGI